MCVYFWEYSHLHFTIDNDILLTMIIFFSQNTTKEALYELY